MPDIKHNFMGGKMNKDLDERLIPNGEYRDAMNIQVSTSEGSNVGAVENILGNELGCDTDITPAGSVTVGSIADEKNDSLYWLVSGPSLENVSLAQIFQDDSPYYVKDMIMRKTAQGCEPVLVDQWANVIPNTETTIDNSVILSSEEFLDHIYPGMSVYGVSLDPGTPNTTTQTVTSVANLYSISTPYYIEISAYGVTETIIPHGGGATTVTTTGVAVWGTLSEADNASESYYQVADVIFVANSGGVPGGIQVGDLISSDDGTFVEAQVIALLGNGNASNSQFGAFYRINQNVSAKDDSTLPRDLNSESMGADGVLYNIDIYPDNSTFTVGRTTYPLTNQINLPLDSQWLNEISNLFWDTTDPTTIQEISTPTDMLQFSSSGTWPDGGCIQRPDIPIYDPGTGIITYTPSFNAVDCNTGTAIFPTSLPPHLMNLLVGAVNFQQEAFNKTSVTLDGRLNLQAGYEFLVFKKERVLNFSPTQLITGINIIDDMLLWVDGNTDVNGSIVGTEPKKINIKRSIAGTDDDGKRHTMLINDVAASTQMAPPLKEEHITVIKRAPKNALSYDLITSRKENVNYSGIMTICSNDGANVSSFIEASQNKRDFNGVEVGDTLRFEIKTDLFGEEVFSLPWKVGTAIVLKEFDEDNNAPEVPFANNAYTIKGVIAKWKDNTGNLNKMTSAAGNPAQVSMKITSIVGFPPQTTTSLDYVVDTYFAEEKLFEFKFPRFSYRYKYKDGELSTFAPFTTVAFLPGNFVYHPTKGYNLGMTNTITSITVKSFVTPDMPADVTEIDLLYKEDASSNIYILDTLKPNDQAADAESLNNWDNNYYEITSDTIHSVVASNQLLRPWDNVPRKAVSQELTGNRLMYGNYLQNYNLAIGDQDFYPKFSWDLSKNQSGSTTRSIKSLRDYQLGVVFTDKYGRETPVITNSSGTLKITKSSANTGNLLSVGFNGEGPPPGLEYFKFFIKETSGEYYNIAMDRFFNAEDGNYWLSFPSADRNKIDEDTFLILKKGEQSDELVGDKARYKVLAIENEAPDYIKTSRYNIGQLKQRTDGAGDGTPFDGLEDAPASAKNSFSIPHASLAASSAGSLHEIKDALYVEFQVAGIDRVSNRYRITQVSLDATEAYHIKIEGTFGDEIDFIIAGDGIVDGTQVRFYKYKVENKPMFDGRFFVKILNDDVFKSIITTREIGDREYKTVAEKKIYFMSGDHKNRHATPAESDNGTATFGPNANIKDYYNSVGAQALTAFENGAASSAGTSGDWFRYETYFKNKYYDDVDDSGLQIGSNGSYHTKSRGEVFEDVMFIDKGMKSGNHGYMPTFRSYAMWAEQPGPGIGIVNNNEVGRMDLSFGSLEAEEIKSVKIGDGYFTNDWQKVFNNSDTGSPNFYDLQSGERSKYSGMAKIYDKLQSGQQFRWKEDPNQTVYTIIQQVETNNVVRYDNTAWRDYKSSVPYNSDFDVFYQVHDYSTGAQNTLAPWQLRHWPFRKGKVLFTHGTPYTLASNFQLKKRFWFTPSMQDWDPTENDQLGAITGGARVDAYATDWDAPGENNVDLIGYRTAQLADNTMIIDIDQYANIFDSLNGIRPSDNTLEGMILTHVDGTELTSPVLVDSVTQPINSYDGVAYEFVIIVFKGYQGTSGSFDIGGPSDANTVVFRQPSMNGLSVNSANNINDHNSLEHGIGAIGYTMQFIEVKDVQEEILPPNPAVWETEPKESTDLDIYYEISGSKAISLTPSTVKTVIPKNSKISSTDGGGFDTLRVVDNTQGPGGDIIMLSELICADQNGCIDQAGDLITGVTIGTSFIVETLSGLITEVEVAEVLDPVDSGSYFESRTFRLKKSLYNSKHDLDWYNCYSFGNGVESNRIRDSFNLPFITNGVKASTTLENNYKEEHRKYGLIYSGIYNSNSGVNNLNQFIQAEKITKDINPIYGSIQKLHSRSTADGDLIVLCEDRVLKILAEKDALFNADGNPQLIATNRVLGQATPFSGEFGISRNPESFASESYRVYFTDKVRGAVMRLSKDGLSAISDHGMKDWFRDNLKLSTKLIGSYDDRNDEYNITLDSVTDQVNYPNGQTVTFKEDVKGWVSFKSFTPENAISCANEYYTFNQGTLWKHYSETEDRNTFYKVFPVDGEGFTPSSVNVIINESPGTIKTFHTLNYEGTQSKVNTFTNYADSSGNVYNNEYYNLEPKDGWKVQSIITDQEEGSINEFIEKEGKWFNYIRGKAGSVTDGINITSGFDNADFAFQGLGTLSQAAIASDATGCTANGLNDNGAGVVNDYFGDGVPAFNYNPFAMIALNNTCIQTVFGCDDPLADGYSATVNVNDGSCIYYGCTDPLANNYIATTTNDDGSCVYYIYGCMDGTLDSFNNPIMSNYDLSFTAACNGVGGNFPGFTAVTGSGCAGNNVDNCCCVPFVYGCMDPLADNYGDGISYPLANVQATSSDDPTNPCFYTVYGCTNLTSCVYDALANTDDGSCNWCNIETANNYDGDPLALCDSGCLFCEVPINLGQITSGGGADTTINIEWEETWDGNAAVNYYEVTYVDPSGSGGTYSNIQPNSSTQGIVSYEIASLSPGVQYNITVEAFCQAGTSPLNLTHSTSSGPSAVETITTSVALVGGCTDAVGCNYDAAADYDDGSCDFDCYGCIDADANNYNSNATIDDGSCTYTAGCMDPLGIEYNSALVADCNGDLGGTDTNCCTYPVEGCMDGSQNNAGTGNAASNYNASATIDPNGSCQYIDPVLWDQIPTGGASAILGTPGWWTGGVWGTYRKLRVYWDVSLSPVIDANNIKVAYQSSFETSSYFGDIDAFQTPGVLEYSNDDGVTWINLSSWNGTDPIQLITADVSASTLRVPFVNNEQEYPPHVADGKQQLAMQFGFLNSNISVFQTPPNAAIYNVQLGCNDSAAGETGGYNGEIPFFDNSLCVYGLGCMDAAACNYDATATSDDGTCESTSCVGCADPAACNYDGATIDDGSCYFVFSNILGYECQNGSCAPVLGCSGGTGLYPNPGCGGQCGGGGA